MIAARLADCGLELNEQKTRVVYCKMMTSVDSYEHTLFDFPPTRSARGCPKVGSARTL